MNQKPSRDKGNVIIESCAGIVLPIALVLGAYLIIHGHLSPGGGFQGGVIVAGGIAILYAAYGSKFTTDIININQLKAVENISAIALIIIASLGLVLFGDEGYAFFTNALNIGTPGDVYSSGSIFWMNFAVGLKVLAGIGALLFVMIGLTKTDSQEH